jgi:hypothetical protein
MILLQGLFLVISCGKPSDPESIKPQDISGGYKIITQYSTPAFAQDIVKKNDLLYIAQGEGGLVIIDVKDPKNPETLSTITEGVRGHSKKIAIHDSVVYLAAGNYGITVVNVADSTQPKVTVSNLNMKPAKNVYTFGEYLYAAISERGVKIANISYPPQPDIRSGMHTSGYAQAVVMSDDTSYIFAACGEVGMSVFDMSDFQNGFGVYPLIGSVSIPGYAEAISILYDKKIAFLACGTAGLQIIDYSDFSSIKIIGSYDACGYAKELIYQNNKIYMTTEKCGLQIFNVTNLKDPKLIGTVKTTYALGLDADDDYIYLADEDKGLIIISIPK